MKPASIATRTLLALSACACAWLFWRIFGGPALDRVGTGLVALCMFVAAAALTLRASAMEKHASTLRENVILFAWVAAAVVPLPRVLAWWLDASIGRPEQMLGALLGVVFALIPVGFEYLRLTEQSPDAKR